MAMSPNSPRIASAISGAAADELKAKLLRRRSNPAPTETVAELAQASEPKSTLGSDLPSPVAKISFGSFSPSLVAVKGAPIPDSPPFVTPLGEIISVSPENDRRIAGASSDELRSKLMRRRTSNPEAALPITSTASASVLPADAQREVELQKAKEAGTAWRSSSVVQKETESAGSSNNSPAKRRASIVQLMADENILAVEAAKAVGAANAAKIQGAEAAEVARFALEAEQSKTKAVLAALAEAEAKLAGTAKEAAKEKVAAKGAAAAAAAEIAKLKEQKAHEESRATEYEAKAKAVKVFTLGDLETERTKSKAALSALAEADEKLNAAAVERSEKSAAAKEAGAKAYATIARLEAKIKALLESAEASQDKEALSTRTNARLEAVLRTAKADRAQSLSEAGAAARSAAKTLAVLDTEKEALKAALVAQREKFAVELEAARSKAVDDAVRASKASSAAALVAEQDAKAKAKQAWACVAALEARLSSFDDSTEGGTLKSQQFLHEFKELKHPAEPIALLTREKVFTGESAPWRRLAERFQSRRNRDKFHEAITKEVEARVNKTTENEWGEVEQSAVGGVGEDDLLERQTLSEEAESESTDGITALDSDGTAAAVEARALFDRFDDDLDGELDFEEFTKYLMSVFEAMAGTAAFQAQVLTPAEMAEETAAECFEEADLDGDGALTFDEFEAWYLQSQNQQK